MKSISFKNFRRFADFPEFKFGDVTILVGGNNSGKSTLIKAINFLTENLKYFSTYKDSLAFDSGTINLPIFHSKDMSNYGRIHRIDSKDSMEFCISFDEFGDYGHVFPGDLERFVIKIVFKHAQPNDRSVEVSKLIITDYELGLRISCSRMPCSSGWNVERTHTKIEWIPFDMTNVDMDINTIPKSHINLPFEEFLCKYKTQVDDSIVKGMFGEDWELPEDLMKRYMEYNLQRANLTYKKRVSTTNPIYEESFEFEAQDFSNEISEIQSIGELMARITSDPKMFGSHRQLSWRIRESAKRIDQAIMRLGLNKTIITSERIDIYRPGDKVYPLIRKFFNLRSGHLFKTSRKFHISGTVSVKKTLTDYLRWLLIDFEIGQDFKIEPIVGYDSYTVQIQSSNGQWVNLSELGTGSIKLFELFLNVLTSSRNSYLYIEEPEQNLHPKMQSRLADLFYEFSTVAGRKLIIETHSEYLIRRTQVLVAKMNLNEEELEKQNPFKVYYFDPEIGPYDMKYLPSGRFENKFGEGFFDESAKWHMEILKKEKARK